MPTIDTPYGPIEYEGGLGGAPERPPDVNNRPSDPAEFAAWKEKARKWRAWSWAKDNWRDTQLAMGASLEDLGIRPVKEQGLAAYNKFAKWDQEGLSNPGFIYDWASGKKKNVATSDSDPNSPTGNQSWQSISPEEWQQYNAQKGFGNNQGDYIARLQAQQRAWIDRALEEGQLRRDPRNGLIWDGENTYFDDYGAVIDPNSKQRVGGVYGDAVFGDTSPYRPTGQQAVGQVSIPKDFVASVNPTQQTGNNTTTTTEKEQPFNYYSQGYNRPYLKKEDPVNYRGWYGSNFAGSVGQPTTSAMQPGSGMASTPINKQLGTFGTRPKSEFGVLPGEDYPGATKGGVRATKPKIVPKPLPQESANDLGTTQWLPPGVETQREIPQQLGTDFAASIGRPRFLGPPARVR